MSSANTNIDIKLSTSEQTVNNEKKKLTDFVGESKARCIPQHKSGPSPKRRL